jgi:hypothetical protein
MKLRISGDSVRLRLKQGEVERIASGESVEAQTHFAGSVLTYRLDVGDGGDFTASFAGDRIIVCLPKERVHEWTGSDQVSLYSEQAVTDTGTLSILIEKDFACLVPGHHRGCEDDADTFPHPAQSTDSPS